MGATAPTLANAATVGDLTDWGTAGEPIEGHATTAGVLLHKGPDGAPEAGVWVCTPGTWALEVERDEFCHFLAGRCTYTHEAGETIEIAPDTIAFFPAGWRGTCRVHDTVRKVYMIG